MGYYVRAFCKNGEVPTIRQILDWSKERNINLTITDEIDVDIDSNQWEQFAIEYKKNKSAILVECNRDEGTEDCLFREEISEFLEFIGSPGLSLKKRKLIKHLKSTKFIIANQLPTSDIDDDGYDANGEILRYFINNNGAIIQADGEGFYEGEKLILSLE